MTPEEIARSYDALAAYWEGDEFNRKNGIEQHKRALRFVKNKGLALDIGCGCSGRFIDLLLSEGFEVEGLDISSEMIRRARVRHPQVCFHQADVCDWVFPRQYDFITAWDSIWHVPLGKQAALMERVCAALASGGILIFTCGGLDAEDERTNPCQGQPLYHATLGLERLQKLAFDAECSVKHLEFDQLPHPHVFLILQKV